VALQLALVVVIVVSIGLVFTVPVLAPVLPAIAVYFYLFGRASRLANEYVAALAETTHKAFGPRPHYRPWYLERSMTGFLQRISRDLSLYRQQSDPTLEAMRKRALHASWLAPIAATFTFGAVGALEFAMSAHLLTR